jgi:uncharacterized damage-inducible protein DinB
MDVLPHIAHGLSNVFEGENWTDVYLRDVVQDLSWEEAITRTPASPNSIAAIVNHLTYWNGVIRQRLQGTVVPISENNGFNLPPISSDVQWRQLIDDYCESVRMLNLDINGLREEEMGKPILPNSSSVYSHLQGLVEHAFYHMGQMIILKKFIRAQRPPASSLTK